MQSAPQPSALRVEEASLNAWPALRQVLFDGWIVRFAGGFTKRANSVSILYPSPTGTRKHTWAEHIDYCELLFEQQRLQPIFRLTSLCDPAIFDVRALDAVLAQRGYTALDRSDVLCVPLACNGTDATPAPAPEQLPLNEWLLHYSELSGAPAPARQLHGLLLQGIPLSCCFAVVRSAGRVVACGLAVAENELMGVFDVVTATSFRGQGLGRQLMQSLQRWGTEQGARFGYLQVLRDNLPAQRLYQQLNYEPLYEYWYRVKGSPVA